MGDVDSAGWFFDRSVGYGVGSVDGITFSIDDGSGMSYSDTFLMVLLMSKLWDNF